MQPELGHLSEQGLRADFNKKQRVYFDKLMSELEEISGGLGFSELEAEARSVLSSSATSVGSSSEAIQKLRDYIAKKEQIVGFIEQKELPETYELRDEELEVGDEVYLIEPTTGFVRKGKISNFFEKDGADWARVITGDDGKQLSFCKIENLAKNKPKKLDAGELGELVVLDLSKYQGFGVGDIYHNFRSKNRKIEGFCSPDNAVESNGFKPSGVAVVFSYGEGIFHSHKEKMFGAESIGSFKEAIENMMYKKIEDPNL